MKDSRGFVWFGTLEGLHRYDGKFFVVYKNNPKNKNSLIYNSIFQVFEDKKGRIWANSSVGLSCMDVYQEKFINYYPSDTTKYAMKYHYTIALDSAGNVYNNAFQWLDEVSQKWYDIPNENDGFNHQKDQELSTVSRNIKLLSDNQLWKFGADGIFKLDQTKKSFQRYLKARPKDGLDLFRDHSGRMWYGEWDGGLNEFMPNEQRIINYVPNQRISHIAEYKDNNNKYWIIASEGNTGSILVLDPISGKFTEQLLRPENELIESTWPGYMYVDNENKLWVTSSNGIFVAEPSNQAVKNFWQYDRNQSYDSYYQGLIRTVFKLKDGYAVSLLGNGVRIYDDHFKEKKYIQYIKDRKGEKVKFDVRASFQLDNGDFILSGINGGMRQYNFENNTYHFLSKGPTIKGRDYENESRDMLAINEQEYWVRFTSNIVAKYNIKKDSFTKVYDLHQGVDRKDRFYNLDIETTSMCYDSTKKLWLSTVCGLFYYDRIKDIFINEKLKAHSNGSEELINNLNFINAQDNENLWVSTDGGLFRYHIASKTTMPYINESNQAASYVYKTVFDRFGKLWCASSAGLFALDTLTKTFTNYYKENGMALNVVQREVGMMINENDELIVGNAGVFSVVKVKDLNAIVKPDAEIRIMHVKGKDGMLPIKFDKNQVAAISVKFEDLPISVLFSIIDFSIIGNRKYYYKLEKKNKKWKELPIGNYSLEAFDPGKYTIWLSGSVNGIMCKVPKRIDITIIPAWYQTIWFRLSSTLFVLTLIYLFYKSRINNAKRTASQQLEIQKLKSQELQHQLYQEQINAYFSSSIQHINIVDDVLWDVARNLISKLEFEDCMIYLWNDDYTKMVPKAGLGPKGSIEYLIKDVLPIVSGQGLVGYVIDCKEAVIIDDCRVDQRASEIVRMSELCVPIMHDDKLIGIIHSKNSHVGYYNNRHVSLLSNIGALVANKIKSIEAQILIQKNKVELVSINEQLQTARLEAFRSQMNPHFLFNSLNSIDNYITKNDKKAASEYLHTFAKLIRNTLDSTRNELVPFIKDFETIRWYIQLEQMRFRNIFAFNEQIDDNILNINPMVPPMLVQPFIENAILHGFVSSFSTELKLTIEVKMQGSFIIYTITDNGIGRKASKEFNSLNIRKSEGLNITTQRLKMNNGNLYQISDLTIVDLECDGGIPIGTRVVLKIYIK